MKSIHILAVLTVFFLVACNGKSTATNELGVEYIGKKITFPDGMSHYSLRSHTETSLSNELQRGLKIVSLIDASCGTCLVDLYHWDQLAIKTPEIGGLQKMIVFHAEDNFSLFRYLVKDSTYNNLDIVWLDGFNQLAKLNELPTDHYLQTFLLDEDNKVLAVGNPNSSQQVLETYLQRIGE